MNLFSGVFSELLKGALGQIDSQDLSGVLSKMLGQTNLGSLGGLLSQLQEAGLDKQVGSWLGNGKNLPISPDQLRSALGNEQLQQMARAAGLPTDDLLKVLSQHLPQAVDNASPNGALEEPEDKDQEEPERKEEPDDDQQQRDLAEQAGLNDIGRA